MVHRLTAPPGVELAPLDQKGFVPTFIQCPICIAGRDLLELDAVEVHKGGHEVRLHGDVAETRDLRPTAEPDPTVDLHFTCYAGHGFTLRLRATATGKVAMTALLAQTMESQIDVI